MSEIEYETKVSMLKALIESGVDPLAQAIFQSILDDVISFKQIVDEQESQYDYVMGGMLPHTMN